MNRNFALLSLFSAACLVPPLAASAQVMMAWTLVGNPGNAPDRATGYGDVDYPYNVGTYDVTISQYVAFLNSNDPTGADPLALYNSNMGKRAYGGIIFNRRRQWQQIQCSSRRRPPSGELRHVLRHDGFANWLNNGQTPGSTETGAYPLGRHGDGGFPATAIASRAGNSDRVSSEPERVVQSCVLQ